MGEKKRRLAGGAFGSPQAESLALQARALVAQGAFGPALDALGRALQAAPHLDRLWAQFGELIRFFRLRDPHTPALRALLERALAHPAVDPGNLVLPIVSAALSRADGDPFGEPLLLRLMHDTIVRDAKFEELLVAARERAGLPLEARVAIAHQCFNTEYVAPQPDAQLAEPHSLEDLARYAAGRPLHTLPDREGVAARLENTPLASLARRQILEPLQELRLLDAIPAVGGTSGSTSRAVQAQYEENPYPRWIRMQTRFEGVPLAQLVQELFPGVRAQPGPARVLVAGCGTGQNAIATALRFSDSSVLAIDLSRASLAYARRKADELGVPGIEFRHADLLELGSLGERFQLVEASGVLHHLADPLAGWRVLAGLVAPGGFMRIGLYSARGRRHFTHARTFVREKGFQATPEGIRGARAAIRAAAANDEMLARVARNEDFFSMSGCRDMLFHVQEREYELPEIARAVEELGFDFLGFEFDDSGITASRYRARFPGDARLRDLGHWHLYEQENPDAFTRMYEFWLQRR
jgi:SAM-dependent methyltransferase